MSVAAVSSRAGGPSFVLQPSCPTNRRGERDDERQRNHHQQRASRPRNSPLLRTTPTTQGWQLTTPLGASADQAMDPNWQQYHDPANGAARRHNHNGSNPQMPPQQVAAPGAGAAPPPQPQQQQQQQQQHQQQPQQQPPPQPAAVTYGYDQYHANAAAAAAAVGVTPPVLHHGNPPPAVVSPMAPGHQPRDGNGDTPMRDAHDSHAGIKYAMRPHHQPHMSGGAGAGRPAGLHSPLDQQQQQQHAQQQLPPSAAAQRYSPMETFSPTSPYGPKASQFSGPPSQTHSPATGSNEFAKSPYYGGRQHNPQLPPMSPYSATPDGYPSATVATLDGSFAHPSQSPHRQPAPAVKPVPEFRKVRAPSDLHPKQTRQPPFRRANPEGGFISVRVHLVPCSRS